jgi:hypothetical protein
MWLSAKKSDFSLGHSVGNMERGSLIADTAALARGADSALRRRIGPRRPALGAQVPTAGLSLRPQRE